MLSRKFRMLGFAVVTLVGAVHVSTASASPRPLGLFDACDTYAQGYAAGFCAAQGKSVCGLSYTCIGHDATPIDISAECC
jgi:hypothetical protein